MSTPETSSHHLLHEEPPQSAIIAALLALKKAGNLQQQYSAVLINGLETLVSDLRDTQEQVDVLTAGAADAKVLAMYRGPIRRWCTRRAKALDMDWSILADKLDLEEDGSEDED